MRTKMVPQYANIFMANLEENILQNTHNKPLIYLKYIDDIFLLWTHGKELLKFHKDFNLEDPDIHITMNHSAEEVNFLDTTIRLKNNTFQTSLCKKTCPFPNLFTPHQLPCPTHLHLHDF